MAGERLRVLFVEDSPDDEELELLALRRGGFVVDHERVFTAEALNAALDARRFDLVIADYDMHGFTGLEALRMVRGRGLDVPFVLVSGTVGEDVAVEAMKAGAQDYVMKDNLRRLASAVRRELAEHASRRLSAKEADHRVLLAEASALLLRGIDPRPGVAELAELLVSRWCDACVVRLDGEDELRAVRLGAPVGERLEELAAVARASQRSEAASAEGRVLVAPLAARGAPVGVLAALRLDPERAFGASEVAFTEELGRRVALAAENGRLHARTREALRMRDDFLTVASHELRTPLTALQLQQELLVRGARAGGPGGEHGERLLENLEKAVRQTRRLAELVESVLDASALVMGRVTLDRNEPVDLAEVVETTARELRPVADVQRCDLTLTLATGARGRWDRVRLQQVVASLLANAIKFGAGRPIRAAVALEGRSARLAITDHGIGVAPADQERIFRCFERAVSVENYGGLGLGLYSARRIVEAHAGRISVTSDVGQGATFLVELPIDPP